MALQASPTTETMPTNTGKEIEAGPQEKKMSKAMKLTLLVINCAMLALGNTGGPLLLRLYFIRGGTRKWLTSWLQTGGWPLVLIPISISFINRRRKEGRTARLVLITPHLFAVCAAIGILTGLDDYMYAYGSSYLPVSTSSILISSQLVFNSVFALLVVRHKFTPYSVNAVILLTIGAVVLGIRSGSDRPSKETNFEYYLGFFLTIGAAALYGLLLPLLELTYRRTKQAITYALVMEMQMVLSFFATAFCTVGMLVNKDFKVIPREAREYALGDAVYYLILAACAVLWQFFFLGMVGVVSCSSSLHAGVLIAALIPVTEILAVFFFTEKFNAEKGIALFLSLWGFASYFYGEVKKYRREKHFAEMELREKQEMDG